jgi:hypothetical protein
MAIFLDPSTDNHIAISINALGNSAFPEQSISIIDIEEPNKPKTFLGLIKSEYFTENNAIIDALNNTYGLYSDNAYIKGSLINTALTENNEVEYVAGISAQSLDNM